MKTQTDMNKIIKLNCCKKLICDLSLKINPSSKKKNSIKKGGQQILTTKFQDFLGLFELKNLSFLRTKFVFSRTYLGGKRFSACISKE